MAQQPRAETATRTAAYVLALALVTTVLTLGVQLFTARADAVHTDPVQASETQAKDEVHPELGMTFAKNGVLRKGCRNYRYSYEIHPPDEGSWALETFIIGPKDNHLASGGFLEGFDETTGTSTYRICKPTTRPGVFRIKAKLSTVDSNDTYEAWLPVTKFRLRARR